MLVVSSGIKLFVCRTCASTPSNATSESNQRLNMIATIYSPFSYWKLESTLFHIKADTPTPVPQHNTRAYWTEGRHRVDSCADSWEDTFLSVCILNVEARSWAKITLSSLCFGTDIGEYKWKLEGKGKTGAWKEYVGWMSRRASEWMVRKKKKRKMGKTFEHASAKKGKKGKQK